ncbi:MAG: hypothetical protein QOC76_1833 [Mycobacterium sp.]|nr:hypothetical protein [Mycobacterium sp.]
MPGEAYTKQDAAMQASASSMNSTDCRLLGHWISHIIAMTPQQTATRTLITQPAAVRGPTGVHMVRIGAAPSAMTTVAIMRRVKPRRFRYPR